MLMHACLNPECFMHGVLVDDGDLVFDEDAFPLCPACREDLEGIEVMEGSDGLLQKELS